MVAPRKNVGTWSPRTVADGGGGKGGKGGKPNATSKGDKGQNKGDKKKRKGSGTFRMNMPALNPEFDPRMRRVGSPLNAANKIKRGWVQTEEDNLKVNFLFNPSELSLQHQILDSVRTDKGVPDNDKMVATYASTGSTTGVKLLYDRTYELYSPGANGRGNGFANRFGVWADVAAWYVLLGMLPEMPTSWESSFIINPAQPKTAYLFVGPKMIYYGWLTGINVVYSHWTQNMIPARCAVDVGFGILPYPEGQGAPLRGKIDNSSNPLIPGGTSLTWADDWILGGWK